MSISVPDQIEIAAHANRGSGLNFPFPMHICEVNPHQVAAAFATTISELLQRKEPKQRHVVIPMEWKIVEHQEDFLPDQAPHVPSARG